MPEVNYELRIFNYKLTLFWKWEASSKNNALTYRVRRGSSASKGIIFYLLNGMFLIAFMNSWCHWIVFSLQCQIFRKNLDRNGVASAIVKAIYLVVCGKWKMILLLALLVLWVLKMALTIGKSTEHLSHFSVLTKAKQTLPI